MKRHPRFGSSAACDCRVCVSMCKRNPCWPTPKEAQAISDVGFGKRLMADWWEEPGDSRTLILCPASVGHEGKMAPEMPLLANLTASWSKGRCTFLTKAGRCELHDRGLKPLEGRVMHHKSTVDDSTAVRAHIVSLWRRTQNHPRLARNA